jgi:hypothetical protein
MKKTWVYLREEELDALRLAASRSGRTVSGIIRDAIRRGVLTQPADAFVAIWDGRAKVDAPDHDSIYDKL